jgi:7-carboxy-7-deazaguanine synthase
MSYSVKEIYYTLQGEGLNAGRAAIFCRFSGCNLWSGLEADREAAVCRFCDTSFVGTDGEHGGRYAAAEDLAAAIAALWPDDPLCPGFVVFTGGEPLLQLDSPLIDAMHARGYEIAVETNGTRVAPVGIDHLCVSPKANTSIVVQAGHELKLVFPQEGVDPAAFETWDFRVQYLQPMDGPEIAANTLLALEYCRRHPAWRLSTQRHKELGIP